MSSRSRRSASRYPSVFGHTPSYRSYLNSPSMSGDPYPYYGPPADPPAFSAYWPGNSYNIHTGDCYRLNYLDLAGNEPPRSSRRYDFYSHHR